jgi:endonuclease III
MPQKTIPKHPRATRATHTKKPVIEQVYGGWEVLPHGLGDINVNGKRFNNSNDLESEPHKKQALDTSKEVVHHVEELIEASEDPLKRIKAESDEEIKKEMKEEVPEKKKKSKEEKPKKVKAQKNKYGLTPGHSPFPDHAAPSSEDCEKVHSLLASLHGEIKAPKVIPPPSATVTGCGEVPDLLDAILRTLLSASTTANNANMSMAGLQEKFGKRTTGVGAGSCSWETVHQASLEDVVEAIKRGGLANTKGKYIKQILDVVYERNKTRYNALIAERKTGKLADILGMEHATKAQKDAEIARFEENMLSMDHIFEMTTDEAMEEMTKLPGIGVKTASCVILFCMKRPSFAVDTHVWRHCKWLGWVPENASRDKTFSHCEVRIPDHLKYGLHALFLRHGKTCGRCRAATPANTEDWNNTVCPIDHLLKRTEAKKQPDYKPSKKDLDAAAKEANEIKAEDSEISEGGSVPPKSRANRNSKAKAKTTSKAKQSRMAEMETDESSSEIVVSEDENEDGETKPKPKRKRVTRGRVKTTAEAKKGNKIDVESDKSGDEMDISDYEEPVLKSRGRRSPKAKSKTTVKAKKSKEIDKSSGEMGLSEHKDEETSEDEPADGS